MGCANVLTGVPVKGDSGWCENHWTHGVVKGLTLWQFLMPLLVSHDEVNFSFTGVSERFEKYYCFPSEGLSSSSTESSNSDTRWLSGCSPESCDRSLSHGILRGKKKIKNGSCECGNTTNIKLCCTESHYCAEWNGKNRSKFTVWGLLILIKHLYTLYLKQEHFTEHTTQMWLPVPDCFK